MTSTGAIETELVPRRPSTTSSPRSVRVRRAKDATIFFAALALGMPRPWRRGTCRSGSIVLLGAQAFAAVVPAIVWRDRVPPPERPGAASEAGIGSSTGSTMAAYPSRDGHAARRPDAGHHRGAVAP